MNRTVFAILVVFAFIITVMATPYGEAGYSNSNERGGRRDGFDRRQEGSGFAGQQQGGPRRSGFGGSQGIDNDGQRNFENRQGGGGGFGGQESNFGGGYGGNRGVHRGGYQEHGY